MSRVHRATAGAPSADLTRAWDATVTLEPDIRSKIPFLSSSRRGSGVVVSLDGTGHPSSLVIVTAAHVACLAGSRNSIRVRSPSAKDDRDGAVARVVGVHARLDLAVLTFATDDDGDDQNQNQNQNQNRRAWLPLAPSAPRARDPIAALGYPMGWSGAIKRAANAARGGARRSSRWGEVLAGFPNRTLAGEPTTHLLHTSAVASGESGGPLVNAALEVCGVHSFGDHFTGGERDVAVAVSAATLRGCFVRGADNLSVGKAGGEAGREDDLRLVARAVTAAAPVAPAAYDTAGVNAMIVESSDPALAAMCPELTREQRMSWIM